MNRLCNTLDRWNRMIISDHGGRWVRWILIAGGLVAMAMMGRGYR